MYIAQINKDSNVCSFFVTCDVSPLVHYPSISIVTEIVIDLDQTSF